MYARLFKFQAGADQRSAAEAMADRAFGLMKSLKGFISVHFVIADDNNGYGSFSLWESREDADNAGDEVRAEIASALESIATAAPEVEIYEVYKPGQD